MVGVPLRQMRSMRHESKRHITSGSRACLAFFALLVLPTPALTQSCRSADDRSAFLIGDLQFLSSSQETYEGYQRRDLADRRQPDQPPAPAAPPCWRSRWTPPPWWPRCGGVTSRVALMPGPAAVWIRARRCSWQRSTRRGLAAVNASTHAPWWPVFRCPLVAGFGCPPRIHGDDRQRAHALWHHRVGRDDADTASSETGDTATELRLPKGQQRIYVAGPCGAAATSSSATPQRQEGNAACVREIGRQRRDRGVLHRRTAQLYGDRRHGHATRNPPVSG